MNSRKMLVAASLQLFDILTKLLYINNNEERDLSTLTKLALVQNRDTLARDIIMFKQELNSIQEDLGINPDTVDNLSSEQNKEFEDRVKASLAKVVEHTLVQVDREELEYIKDIHFTTEELSLIAATLIKQDAAVVESAVDQNE